MIYLIPALFSLVFVIGRLLPISGMVGHDYAHYYTRILIGVDHFIKNGFSVPHFTPYLCGGVPYFADPQIYFYSLPQFLAFFISPFVATYFSYALFYAIGYWGMLQLCREFKLNSFAAHLGALGFLLNGFSFAHLFVGHANHYQFLLLPWLVVFPLRAVGLYSFQWWRALSLFSFCVLYCFYSGAMHILVVGAAMFSLFLPSLVYIQKRKGELKSLMHFGFLSFGILLLTCSGKFAASYLYSRHFAIHGIDRAATDWLTQILRYFWFNPENSPSFIQFGEWAFGPWEYVGFISKLSIPALVCLMILVRKYFSEKFLVLSTILLSLFWLSLSQGTPLNKWLPFFNSYHNPLKLLGGFIVPLLLVWAWGIEQCGKFSWAVKLNRSYRFIVYLLLSGILICEYAINTDFFLRTPGALGYRYHPEAYTFVKKRGGFPPVREISGKTHADLSEALKGHSSLACYEPLFGYRLEKFQSRLAIGNTQTVLEPAYNLNHPGCFLYGSDLKCVAWDRISGTELAEFEQFRNGRAVEGWVPSWQRTLIWINQIAVFLLLIPIILPVFLEFKLRLYFYKTGVEA